MRFAIPIQRLTILLLSLAMLYAQMARGAEPGYVLSAGIDAAKKQGIRFDEYNLFTTTGTTTQHTGTEEVMLSVNQQRVTDVYNTAAQGISLSLVYKSKTYTLALLRSNTFSRTYKPLFADNTGTHSLPSNTGLHYQGAVSGDDKSVATMSVFANGDVMILFACSDGNFVLGKMKDNSGQYILYNDAAIRGYMPFYCALPNQPNTGNAEPAAKTTSGNSYCKPISFYWETDYDLFKFFGQNTTTTQNYISGLFNQVQAIFKNESVSVYLASSLIWTKPDKYLDSSAAYGLMSFEAAWVKRKDTFGADMAMLLASDKGDLGGIASLNAVCKANSPYAYCDVNGVYNNVPVYSWDVFAVCHEAGHLLGSYHTQWCGWMTGTSGTCGSIDDCSLQDSYLACTSCPSAKDNSQPPTAWQGSIMSYCYKGRGVNLANGFEKLPGDKIRSNIGSAGCLPNLISGKLHVQDICQGTGSVVFVPDSIMYKGLINTSTLLYYWNTGATTHSIYNITTPGLYGVSITDANGNCQIQYNTPVVQINTDSCRFKLNTVEISGTDKISIYPNPCTALCNIAYRTKSNTPYSIAVYDLLGKLQLSTGMQYNSPTSINTTKLSSGVYILSVQTANGTQYERLIVQ